MRILVLNGPNLNMLGVREPDRYGSATLTSLEASIREAFPEIDLLFFQSNHEGELIDSIQACDTDATDGIVFNPGGYTHTSVAIRDAMASIGVPVIEVHITNIAARESFRHNSVTAGAALGQISGLGTVGYHMAIDYFQSHHK
jgi:3-dehydroquinate dehydratase II